MNPKNWGRRQQKITLYSLLRDALIARIPFPLPRLFRKALYGKTPNFIFMLHPRTKADIYSVFPFLHRIVRWIPERWVMRGLAALGAASVYAIDWPARNVRGLVVSTLHLPQEFFGRREKTMKIASSNFRLFHRMGVKDGVVALAGWWPAATNLGRSLVPLLQPADRMTITTGHTGTLFSLERTTLAVLNAIGVPPASARVAILGVGNMGSAFAKTVNGTFRQIGLFDRNDRKTDILARKLQAHPTASDIFVYHPAADRDPNDREIADFLAQYDVAVCTTMNTRHIIHDVRSVRNCIIIDDSRPEAFPRVYEPAQGLVVLEGGLIRLPGAQLEHDNGWGPNSDSVFGCMAEGAILSAIPRNTVNPTIGDIDPVNYRKLCDACDELGVTEGEFYCGNLWIDPEELRAMAAASRHRRSATPTPQECLATV